jgi:hypothetical protein
MSRWYRALGVWLRARSRSQRLALAGLLAAALGIGVWVVVGGGGRDALWFDGSPVAGPAGEPAPQSEGGAAPERGSGPREESGPPAETPPPYVQPFAEQPGAKARGPLPSPTAGVEIAEGTDGCDHAYGDRDVCVPWEFPAGVTDKCGWLKERGFEPLKITGGRDRHGLDRDGDGTACGPGD